jgi:protein PhnA
LLPREALDAEYSNWNLSLKSSISEPLFAQKKSSEMNSFFYYPNLGLTYYLYTSKIHIMSENTACPECKSPYGYPMDALMVCPECAHEWNPDEVIEDGDVVKDANGTVLQNGDDVIVMKNLPVKGAPKPVKAGTKVKNIRLGDGDHNISCKIDGFGAMGLKSEFVKKA